MHNAWGPMQAEAAWGLHPSSGLSTCTEFSCHPSLLILPQASFSPCYQSLALWAVDQHSHPAGQSWELQTHIHSCSVNLVVSNVYQLISFTLLLGFFLQKGKGTTKVVRSCFSLGILIFLPREHPGKFLHLASCMVSLDVTMNLTKGDRRV